MAIVEKRIERTAETTSRAPRRVRRYLPVGLLLLFAPALVWLFRMNPSLGALPETIASGVTALSLAREGNVDVSEYFSAAVPGRSASYAVVWRGKQLHGIEPIASSLTFVPFFLPHRSDIPSPGRESWPLFAAVSAQLATITLIVLGLWLLQLVPAARALLVTCIVGIATCYRTINGSGLWQHTSSALWLVLGLATWTKAPARPSLYPLAGAALALATACRPILVPAALLVVVDAARRRGLRQALPTGFVVAGIGGAALYANWYLHGSLLGGRAEIVEHAARTHQVTSYFQFSLLHYLGLLFAPSRGLFVYSPVLLFALPGLVRLLTASAPPPLRDITIAGLLVFGLYGFVATWWGGWVYGPRYMADLLPFFALWLALTPPLVTRAARVVFVATLAWSIAVPQLGAMTHPCGWNRTPRSVDQDPSRLWSLRDTEISRCLAVLTQRSASRNPPPAGRRRPGALQPATRHAAGSPP